MNKLPKLLCFLTAIVLAAHVSASLARAATVPTFPLCINPQGETKVSYAQGTHGIVGDSGTYTGADTVYTLSDNALSQCFCSEEGSGIQTNWWKISELSQSEIEALKNDGWIWVPTGSVWGLDDDPYLAKNSAYSCTSGGTGGTDSNDNSSSDSNNTGGDILSEAASTGFANSVLGLADTGSSKNILFFLSTGTLLFVLGFLLRQKNI
ncbi:hypothetical protein C4579_02390 [Candidatus Microgenomates bacterium]|nr:MAG: hypothetical protein C4579_02390 [Candidatus Microgenomates bacterium]